jgi:hypothetical protein
MIEKGFTPEEAKAFLGGGSTIKKVVNPYGTLKWGIVFAFVGLGLVISYIFSEVYDMGDSITFALILLFGGIGFITYYIIVNSKMKKDTSVQPKAQ